MLKHLHIQNYALITHLDIDFNAGFSVLTGETGAGKSIILGALALVLGARADSKGITDGETKCIIEAEFDDCIIRRELYSNGKSRSFVDDSVVTLQELKDKISIITNETQPGANTAQRVGTILQDIVNYTDTKPSIIKADISCLIPEILAENSDIELSEDLFVEIFGITPSILFSNIKKDDVVNVFYSYSTELEGMPVEDRFSCLAPLGQLIITELGNIIELSAIIDSATIVKKIRFSIISIAGNISDSFITIDNYEDVDLRLNYIGNKLNQLQAAYVLNTNVSRNGETYSVMLSKNDNPRILNVLLQFP